MYVPEACIVKDPPLYIVMSMPSASHKINPFSVVDVPVLVMVANFKYAGTNLYVCSKRLQSYKYVG
jgi:hypothetical protein